MTNDLVSLDRYDETLFGRSVPDEDQDGVEQEVLQAFFDDEDGEQMETVPGLDWDDIEN